jgi:hypothetical protein
MNRTDTANPRSRIKYNKYVVKLTNKNLAVPHANKKVYLKKLVKYGGASNYWTKTDDLYKNIVDAFNDNQRIHFSIYTNDLKLYTVIRHSDEIYYFDEDIVTTKDMTKDDLHLFKSDFFKGLSVPYVDMCYDSQRPVNDFLYFATKCIPFFGNAGEVPTFK